MTYFSYSSAHNDGIHTDEHKRDTVLDGGGIGIGIGEDAKKVCIHTPVLTVWTPNR